MHAISFLQDLAVVLIVAGCVTVIFHRFRQPVVLGYVIAGVIIGPHTPPFELIHDRAAINTLAELGVILLMFGLGLEFNFRKLKQVGVPASIAAVLEIMLMVWLGYQIGQVFGWSHMDSIFLGAMLSISSTTIIVKALSELGKTRERFAQLIFGILVIEDLLAIAMIALLSGLAMTGEFSFVDVALTFGRLGSFMVVLLVAGLIAVPRLLSYVAKFKSNEMLLITVLALCFGVALLAVRFGYSVALGAFVIGAIIAEAREIHRIESLVEPVRDMFSAIFFVAIGLLFDPGVLVDYWLPVLVITAVVVAGKVAACSFGAFIGGNDRRTSLRVGMGLAQIGEFSFIIASLGLSLNVMSPFLYPIAVAVSAVTTLLTPYLIRSADGVVNWFERVGPQKIANYLDLYTKWTSQLADQRRPSFEGKLARRWIWQMALNAALIASVFVGAVLLAQRRPAWLPTFGLEREALNAALWLVAVILCLPMFIATFRKLQALGLLTAETRVSQSAAGERTAAIRTIVAQAIPIAGTIAMGLFVLLLSSALLPRFNVLIALVTVAGALAWLLWRSFIKVYSKAQIAIEETFAQPPIPRQEPPSPSLPPLLREASLETVTLLADSPAAGKYIGELALRTRTGASIVGIQRNSVRIINPGPDEDLQAGDEILLLGTPAQLENARVVFTAAVDGARLHPK